MEYRAAQYPKYTFIIMQVAYIQSSWNKTFKISNE